MSDPFGDMGVVEVEEENVAESDLQAAQHGRRLKDEEVLAGKLVEISAIRTRLQQLRFDDTIEKEDKARQVQNMFKELARLEDETNQLKQKQNEDFINSLNLNEIGINVAKDLPGKKEKRDPYDGPVRPSVDIVRKGAASGDDPSWEDLKMMRTESTATLKDKNASEKWQGLFRMFREWRHQKQVADATYIASRAEGDMLADEIAKLRSAIYSLRQRKSLSQSDQNLMIVLSKKLKALQSIDAQMGASTMPSGGARRHPDVARKSVDRTRVHLGPKIG
eukprot:TRINITY_DN2757_c0_g1_i1.p1 TRINITY_DN2757_c0_g1~~TRINITY_DN2757_c0_g1_i1.p1  ORF type:complete len:278 (+),score=91.90 TRINITY_DN2757_c0_g1_i1:130-963(+)